MAAQVSSYSTAVAVTKSDTTVLNCEGLYIGTTGDVAIIAKGDGSDTAVTLSSVPVGILPIACKKVMSTNTTADDIVALY